MREPSGYNFNLAAQREGIETWVIVNSEPHRHFLDHFLTEDEVWIVLQTREEHSPYCQEFSYNLHIWVGESSVPADAEVAARHAAYFDLRLRRRASLHWERQGHECALFGSYFGYRLTYHPGKYEDIYYSKSYVPVNELFLLRSCKQIIRSKRVECAMSSLNKHDPCILVSDEVIYILPRGNWNQDQLIAIADNMRFGESILRRSDDAHRIIGSILLDCPRQIRGVHHCFVISTEMEDWDNFYELLGWKDKDSFPHLPDGDPPEIESPAPTMLYEIRRNRKGRVYYDTIRQPLQKGDLNSQSMYILTNDKDDVYLWIGKKNQDRNKAKLYGLAKIKEYVVRKKLPSGTHMAIVPEGSEPMEFKRQFQNWIMD